MRHRQSLATAVVLAALLAVTGLVTPALAAGKDGAHVVSKQRISDRIVDLTVQSPALGRTAIVRR